MAPRPCGLLGSGHRARKAFGVRRPEPALWLGHRTACLHARSLRREGKAVTALRSVTAVQTLARVPKPVCSRSSDPGLRLSRPRNTLEEQA
jgi:hypothetical protein